MDSPKSPSPSKMKMNKKTGTTKAKTKPKTTTKTTVPRQQPVVLTTASEVQARMMTARSEGLTIGFVPTMGALHSGHAALIDEARRRADVVVVSIFVNPRQFGHSEDLARYPRPLDADVGLCARCGVDVVFAPSVDEVYPAGFDTSFRAGSAALDLEGAARPGHFDGVLTVVALLFCIVQPHFSVFGEKDFQQLLLVRRLAKDLRLTTEIVAMPVIRNVDGLALSSRNVHLSPADRQRALCLSRGLVAAQDAVQRGESDARVIAAAARSEIDGTAGTEVAYVEVRDAKTLLPIERVERESRLLIAVKVGGVRLIDNGPLFHRVRWSG